jgi:hypothetical protein
MTEYYMHGVSLTDGQIKKIINSAKNHESVTIRLSKNNFNGHHKLPLTKTQINQITRAQTGLNLTLSYSQIKHINEIVSNLEKTGGVIPLLALIPIIASALGAAGGVAGGVASAVSASNNSKAAATAQAELERHNREVEAQLKMGSGVITDYLKQLLQKLGMTISDYYKIIKGGCVRCGKGIYLKPYGSGLYIGPKI